MDYYWRPLYLYIFALLASTIYIDVCRGWSSGGWCDRTCTGIPRECEYRFTLEWYWVLGRMTCGDCPLNMTQCDAQGTDTYTCIPGNGISRPAVTVNRQIPGPAIVVCEGDTIKVKVRNHMEDAAGTSIHWHGLHMRDHQYMDGVPLVTQCNIGYGEEFTYQFPAEQSGTYFWHAHSGLQRSDGIFGALVVRETVGNDPNVALYNHDLTEHVVVINDWGETMTSIALGDLYLGTGPIIQAMTSALINGRGVYRAVTDPTTGRSAYTPRTVFDVTPGRRYRFRVISAATACVFTVFVQGHSPLTVIAADGKPIEPRSVGAIQMLSGERYDFVLRADRPLGNYWLYARGDGNECGGDPSAPYQTKTQQAAIIRYKGAPQGEPGTPALWDLMLPTTPILNPYPRFDTPGSISISDLRSRKSELMDNLVADIQGEPDVRFYVGVGTEPIKFSDPRWKDEPIPGALNINGKLHLPVLNAITFKFPSSPILSQPEEVDDSTFCNIDELPAHCNKTEFCHCLHRLSVKLGDLVEIVFIDENHISENHPVHLHGYSFAVLGQGLHNVSRSDNAPQTKDLKALFEMRTYDEKYGLPRNLDNPPLKDTVSIPLKGYTITRFRADNPGAWFMHCHVEFHASSGMALVLQVGEQSDLPDIPEGFPKCGNFNSGPGPTTGYYWFLPVLMLSLLSYITR